MELYNSLTRRKEPFAPLQGNRVGLYTCGPTVYAHAHIGNFRAYIFEDILRRSLAFNGYDVLHVMNLTDIDDKTIRGAMAAGVALDAYTQPFKDAFFEDVATLRIEPAAHYPAATAHIDAMIALIERLLANGHAYRSEDGSVYFNVARFAGYGRLAHLDVAGLRAGARVAHDEYEKDNVADFALWKAWDAADGDVAWDSPWGRGRPGWHIECSAMSMQYLGEQFDIHTGGIDNMFPHHENEIAQAEGATGKPFVRTWLHCEHLLVEGRKMSKSLGNFYTLRDLTARGYSGRELRYVLMACHYRQALNFTFSALDSARASLARLDDFRARLVSTADGATAADTPPAWAGDAMARFKAALGDDLGMPEALAALFEMVHEGNRAMDGAPVDGEAAAALAVMADMDRVLALEPEEKSGPGTEVKTLLEQRATARREKDWALSDSLRDTLAAMGWVVRDTPDGQNVKRSAP